MKEMIVAQIHYNFPQSVNNFPDYNINVRCYPRFAPSFENSFEKKGYPFGYPFSYQERETGLEQQRGFLTSENTNK